MGAVTSEHELLRGEFLDKLLIIYKSGSVVYYGDILPQFFKRYERVNRPEGGKASREEKPQSIQLSEDQFFALVDILGSKDDFELKENSPKIITYSKDGCPLNLYPTTGKIYAPKGYSVYESIILETISRNPVDPKYDVIIGQDEVGKGEFLGPMIVAGVALTQSQCIKLQMLGVKDSKSLARDSITKLAGEITSNCLSSKLIEIKAERFDELFDDFRNEGKNLNDLLAWAHSSALADVLSNLAGDGQKLVIIDEFDRVKTDKRFKNFYSRQDLEIRQSHRADILSVAVGAASILAKHKRNIIEDLIRKEFGFMPTLPDNYHDIVSHEYGRTILRKSYLNRMVAEGIIIETDYVSGEDAIKHVEYICKQVESHKLDFKEKFPKKETIGKLLSVFSNKEGGSIYFGISDDRKIVGVANTQNIAENISRVFNQCEPVPQIKNTIFDLGDKQILRCTVLKSIKQPVSYLRIYYTRDSGSAFTRSMRSTEIINYGKETL